MTKLIKGSGIILIISIMVYVICFGVLDLKTSIMKKMYPQKFQSYVNQYSKEYEIDPLIIFAIIKTESNFNTKATSDRKAKGLMQIMENTAVDVVNQMETKDIKTVDLYTPETSIKIGTYYFSTLMQKYQNTGLALAAYNAGMGRVTEWIENGTISKDGSNLENIPYQETNMYVRKVLNAYQIYQELYDS